MAAQPTSGLKRTFTAATPTDGVRLGSGRGWVKIVLGGFTSCELQAKHPDEGDAKYVAIGVPDTSNSYSTTISSDIIISIAGGLDYRISPSGSGSGYAIFGIYDP